MTGLRQNRLKAILSAVIIGCGAAAVAAPTASYAEEEGGGSRSKTPSLDQAVAKDLLEAYELMEQEPPQYQQALAKLNELMQRRGDRMKPFDRATVLQIRGAAKVNVGDFAGAIRDFEQALAQNALPPEQAAPLRFNVAQLYFQEENYTKAIQYLEAWIAEAEAPDANAYYLLAAAYFYQDSYSKARRPIERALELMTDPNKRYFDLANIVYSELGASSAREALLRRMLGLWPEEQGYWTQLAGLLSTQDGKEKQAFTVLEVAYNAGLIKDEANIITLAQYYSFFNNPYRGAKLIEREMGAGVVKRNQKNLELLSQLWSQAREASKAIPVLREAAKISDTGELSYRLGQVLLADEQNEAAEVALEQAINKGGLSERDRADTWLLLGTARFNQAGPGDVAKRAEADQAFAQAARFQSTARRASEWRQYISAITDTERSARELEERQRRELAEKAAQQRIDQCETLRLSGQQLTEECVQLLADQEEAEAAEEAPADDAATEETPEEGGDAAPAETEEAEEPAQ